MVASVLLAMSILWVGLSWGVHVGANESDADANGSAISMSVGSATSVSRLAAALAKVSAGTMRSLERSVVTLILAGNTDSEADFRNPKVLEDKGTGGLLSIAGNAATELLADLSGDDGLGANGTGGFFSSWGAEAAVLETTGGGLQDKLPRRPLGAGMRPRCGMGRIEGWPTGRARMS